MNRRRILCGIAGIGVILAGVLPAASHAGQKGNYVRLKAALHELREARVELKEATDTWPSGYRDRAMKSLDDAIGSLKQILGVEDLEKFRGVDRDAEHYKCYKDYPRLRSALQDLRDSRAEILSATADSGNLRERAIDDIDVAIGDILAMVRGKRR